MWKNLIGDPNALRILHSVHDGVIVLNHERRIVFINRTALRLLGYTEEEALGNRCRGVTQTSECGEGCPMNRAIEAGQDLVDIPMYYRNKDGQMINCKANITILRDEAGTVIGGVEVFNDITEISRLQEAALERYSFSNIVGKSQSMQDVYELVHMVAETDSTVLITGESGTGKELVANAIHYHSLRRNKPFVKVNCAALNEGVLESELFGHVRGSFTGAVSDKVGRFEMANEGTLFLDEVGEIPPATQVKLLRVLQEGEIERVGSSKTVKTSVRLIAATNKDLARAIAEGEFRSDLFYRLNVFHIPMPSLRERKEDIPLLVDHFVKKIAGKMPSRNLAGISADALIRLMDYDYPGNIRELENLIEHAAIRSRDGVIHSRDLPIPRNLLSLESGTQLYQIRKPLETLEKDLIVKTLESTEWRVQQSAERLGISRVTLWRKMKEYGLQKPLG